MENESVTTTGAAEATATATTTTTTAIVWIEDILTTDDVVAFAPEAREETTNRGKEERRRVSPQLQQCAYVPQRARSTEEGARVFADTLWNLPFRLRIKIEEGVEALSDAEFASLSPELQRRVLATERRR